MAVVKLSLDEKIKRFLYLGSLESKFFTGSLEKYVFFEKNKEFLIETIRDYAKNSIPDFIKVIKAANEDKLLTRRSTLFYSLAVALNHITEIKNEEKHDIAFTGLEISKDDEEFFLFIKYNTLLSQKKTKFPTTVKKVLSAFYKKKTARELANSYIAAKGYYGFKHKDLLKLSHNKPENLVKDFVVKCILFDSKNISDKETYEGEQQELAVLLKKGCTMRQLKDQNEVIPLIKEFKANFQQVNSQLNNLPEVWAAIIPELPLKQVLHVLPKLYKLGFLKATWPVHGKVIESLTNQDKVKKSNLHPVEVFIHLKNFEKGGKPMDPKLVEFLKTKDAAAIAEGKEPRKEKPALNEPKSTPIITAVHKCLGLAYNNLRPTGKRIMITIDVTEKNVDIPCLHNKNIGCLEASVALTLSILKIERDVTIAVFNNTDVTIMNLEKSTPFQKALQKIQEHKTGCHSFTSPIEFALTKKKNVDVFINFIHTATVLFEGPKDGTEPKRDRNHETFHKYRKKMNLPNAKIITIVLSSMRLAIAAGGYPNIIDIAGFSEDVPKVIESFCRGSFS